MYLLLHDRISSGALSTGARLPAEPDLALEHGVARVTIRRALDQLAQDGLVQRRAGVGTFVIGPAAPKARAEIADVFGQLRAMGMHTDVQLLAFGYVAAPAPVAQALRLAPDTLVQHAVRVRGIEAGPFSHLTTHVPADIGRTFSEAELATQPLLTLLERSGIRLGTARQTITALLAGPDIARLLGVEFGAPLLALTRVVSDAAGRPVEHLRAIYRPDRFSLEMELHRTGADDARRWSPSPQSPIKPPPITPSPSKRPPP